MRVPTSRLLAVVALVTLLAGGALTGCSITDPTVAVAGHDRSGTLVAGGISCDGTYYVDESDLRLVHESEGRAPRELWAIESGAGGRVRVEPAPPPGAPEPPPWPSPARLGRIEMVSVGDPRPPAGYEVRTLLAEDIPASGRLEVEVAHVDGGYDVIPVDLDDDARDSYTVVYGSETRTGLTSVEVADVAADHCDAADDINATPILISVGVAGLVVLLGGAAVAVVTTRQFRRAGEATAAAQRQRLGLP